MKLFDLGGSDLSLAHLQLVLEHGSVAVVWSGPLREACGVLDPQDLCVNHLENLIWDRDAVAVYNVGTAHKPHQENPAAVDMREKCVNVCDFALENCEDWGLDRKTLEHVRERIARR